MVTEYLPQPRSTGLGQAYTPTYLPRILVIDDEASQRILTEANFAAHGFNVDSAANPDEALGYLRRNREKYGVVLCDTNLGRGVFGPDLVDRIREVHSGLIIGTSREEDEQTAQQQWGARAVRFIPKPFGNYSSYVAQIRRMLGRE